MIRVLPSRAALRAALTAIVVHVASCTEPVSPHAGDPAGIVLVSGDAQIAVVGTAVEHPLVVRVVDALQRPVQGATVDFTPIGGGTVRRATTITSWDGTAETRWTLGTSTAEPQRVRVGVAPSRTASVVFTATAQPAPPAHVLVLSGDGQRRPAGVRLRDSVTAQVRDGYGNPVPGVQVTWSTTSGGNITPVVSVTRENGATSAVWTLGPSLGPQTASAGLQSAGLVATFSARATPGPTINGLSPTPVVPGDPALITGTNFGDWPDEVAVAFNDVAARVIRADSTQIEVIVPCEPTGPAQITLRANGAETSATHALAVADPLTLTVGASVLVPEGDVCRELLGGGRYLLAVVNAAGGSGSVDLRLRGGTGGARAATPAMPRATVRESLYTERSRVAGGARPDASRAQAHAHVLEENARVVERLGSPHSAGALSIGARAPAPVSTANLAVNSTVDVKIPDATGDLCTVRAQIRARVVYTGARATILEDIAAPLAGKMDDAYRTLGEEFDNVQWAIISTHFGNPLAYDPQTDRNGRILMVFSRVVNDLDDAVAFTSTGDFYPVTSCAASNSGEIFYGMVPTENAGGYGDGTANYVENWQGLMRSIVIHEVKHITAFAEKFARNGASSPRLEERWLEEGTAVIAEELFARTVYGYGRYGNTNFEQSLFCETRPDPARQPLQCRNKPPIMLVYFELLHDYLAAMTTLSPLGPTPGSDDLSYYGSAWSLLRWAADQFGADEAAFFRALVQEHSLRGVANLEARTGQSFIDLIGDWGIASALDDHPDLSGLQAIHRLPSWNTRDIFRHLHAEESGRFPSLFPVMIHSWGEERFDVPIGGLRAGSASLFDVSSSGGALLVNLTGAIGETVPAEARLKLVRIE